MIYRCSFEVLIAWKYNGKGSMLRYEDERTADLLAWKMSSAEDVNYATVYKVTAHYTNPPWIGGWYLNAEPMTRYVKGASVW